MNFSIVTPSYRQLDWLPLVIASVADQVGDDVSPPSERACRPHEDRPGGSVATVEMPDLTVDHIVQDSLSPGMSDLAAEIPAKVRGLVGRRVSEPFVVAHFDGGAGYQLRLVSESDDGIYDALNKGFARMEGDICAWLNCDEQYLPGTLRAVAEHFGSHPETDLVIGDVILTDPAGHALSYRRAVTPTWLHTRLVHLNTHSCATFFRRRVFSRWPFDTRWRSIGDAEWMSRLLRAGVRVEHLNRPLATFAFTGTNVSESRIGRDEFERWRAEADAPPEWLAVPAILVHRLRKLMAGAYRRRDLAYAIYVSGESLRAPRQTRATGWNWPGP